jgi:hypothetical protein
MQIVGLHNRFGDRIRSGFHCRTFYGQAPFARTNAGVMQLKDLATGDYPETGVETDREALTERILRNVEETAFPATQMEADALMEEWPSPVSTFVE